MALFGGGYSGVFRAIQSEHETAITQQGVGSRRGQMYLTDSGTLMGQFENNAPVPITDLSGKPESATGVPSGSIFMWMGYDAPPGYLLCDGSSQSSSTYSSLFAAIGTKWGGGSGSFNVPNLAGRVAVGAGSPDFFETWEGALTPGATGGKMEVELTNNHMPEHSHSLPDVIPHTHTIPSQTIDSTNHTLAGSNHAHDVDFNSSEPYDSGDSDAYLIDHYIADAIYDDDTGDDTDLKTNFTSDEVDIGTITFDASSSATGAADIDDLSHHHRYESISDWEMYGLPTNRFDTYEGDFQYGDTDDSGLDMADTMFIIGQNDSGAPTDDSGDVDDTFVYSNYNTTTNTGAGADGLAGEGAVAHTHSLGTLSGTVAAHSHTVPTTHVHKVPAAHHHSIDGNTSSAGVSISGDITVPEIVSNESSTTSAVATETGHAGTPIPDKVSVVQPWVCVNYIIKT